MTEKIEPTKYADNIREAYMYDDLKAVEKIEELHGDQEVTLKDLEEMFSYSISLLMTAYTGKDTIDDAKFNILLKTLLDKKVIDVNDEQNIRGEIDYLDKQIRGDE